MTNPNFQEVTDRLLLALGITKETELGLRLGFKQGAWSLRKMRSSLPTAEIDALIAQQEINPEFIYQGLGGVYEGTGWVREYKERAADIRLAKVYLLPMGHTPDVVDALVKMDANDKFKANAYTFITALRDSYKCVEYDLTLLITGIDITKPDGNNHAEPAPSKAEQDLITAYRKADKQGQDFIRRAAGLASK